MTSHESFVFQVFTIQLHRIQSPQLWQKVKRFSGFEYKVVPLENLFKMPIFQTVPVNHRQFDYQKS